MVHLAASIILIYDPFIFRRTQTLRVQGAADLKGSTRYLKIGEEIKVVLKTHVNMVTEPLSIPFYCISASNSQWFVYQAV